MKKMNVVKWYDIKLISDGLYFDEVSEQNLEWSTASKA